MNLSIGTHIPAAEEKMSLARALVLHKAPYFSDAVYGFVFTPVDAIPTMLVTSKLILGFSPQWALVASVPKLAADIYHEVHHFVRKHFLRGAGRNPDIVNIAGDLSINPDIVLEGWDLDELALMPANYNFQDGLAMEEYYEKLYQKIQGGSGKGPPQPSSRGRGKKQPGNGPPPNGSGGTPPPPGIGSGKCGGISGQAAYPAIEAELNKVPDLGRTDVEVQTIEKKVGAAVRAYAASKGRGNLPANLRDLLDAFEEPSWIRWEDELGQVLRETTGRVQAGGQDFSLARPAKRALMWGVVRAGMIERLPEVAIIRDSSGSMGGAELTAAARESYAIVQALGIEEVWFADADTTIASPWQRVGADFFRTLTHASGRGGTDFVKPIESARKLNPQPDILVYLTDGDGRAPKEAPLDLAIVWGIVPGYGNKAPARWGHTVIISDDPKQRNTPLQYHDDTDDDVDDELDADDLDDLDPSLGEDVE